MPQPASDQGGRPFVVTVHGHARPGKVEAARAALAEIAAPTRRNPDCREFRVFQSAEDPHSFTLIERWSSLDAVLAHGRRDYMAEYNSTKDDIFDRLDGDFQVELTPPDSGEHL